MRTRSLVGYIIGTLESRFRKRQHRNNVFSIDRKIGFDRVALINAAWSLGENVVRGSVDPDEYLVFKPLLADATLSPILDKKRGDKALKMSMRVATTIRR